MLAPKTLLPTLLLGAGFAHALTDTCIQSLKGFLTNPDAACLNAPALLQIAVNQNVPLTIGNWLDGFCSAGECSQDAIANVVANVTGGCIDDLKTIGISASQGDVQSTVTSIAQKVFPVARRIACLKDTSKNQFCPVEIITNLESIIGPLGVDDLSWFNLLQDAKSLLTSSQTKSEIACSQCMKSAFSVAREEFGDVLSSEAVSDTLVDVCGADFIAAPAGQLGDNVSQTASTASFAAQSPNSASSMSQAVWFMASVAAAFAFAL
ncbi:hypothetical protein DL96DRAFT_1815720 [Flagelloscypha sp. PMI_526]|nr:hypothetical protein DL96DRAFT_1815720 [Flagelloscypha sp. PMI_526]